jgi:hypothetical protein
LTRNVNLRVSVCISLMVNAENPLRGRKQFFDTLSKIL